MLSLQDVKEPVAKVKQPKNKPEGKKGEAAEAKTVARIESLELKLKEIDLAMSAENIDYEELNSLYRRKRELCNELDSEMDLWLSFGS
jgi:ATP-binding cassette, subfamily F, member 3